MLFGVLLLHSSFLFVFRSFLVLQPFPFSCLFLFRSVYTPPFVDGGVFPEHRVIDYFSMRKNRWGSGVKGWLEGHGVESSHMSKPYSQGTAGDGKNAQMRV